jgi:hypothetical protein
MNAPRVPYFIEISTPKEESKKEGEDWKYGLSDPKCKWGDRGAGALKTYRDIILSSIKERSLTLPIERFLDLESRQIIPMRGEYSAYFDLESSVRGNVAPVSIVSSPSLSESTTFTRMLVEEEATRRLLGMGLPSWMIHDDMADSLCGVQSAVGRDRAETVIVKDGFIVIDNSPMDIPEERFRTKVICRGRRSGRTEELIRMSAELHIPIVCSFPGSLAWVEKRIKGLNYSFPKIRIPRPVLFNDRDGFERVMRGVSRDILIDDIDSVRGYKGIMERGEVSCLRVVAATTLDKTEKSPWRAELRGAEETDGLPNTEAFIHKLIKERYPNNEPERI